MDDKKQSEKFKNSNLIKGEASEIISGAFILISKVDRFNTFYALNAFIC